MKGIEPPLGGKSTLGSLSKRRIICSGASPNYNNSPAGKGSVAENRTGNGKFYQAFDSAWFLEEASQSFYRRQAFAYCQHVRNRGGALSQEASAALKPSRRNPAYLDSVCRLAPSVGRDFDRPTRCAHMLCKRQSAVMLHSALRKTVEKAPMTIATRTVFFAIAGLLASDISLAQTQTRTLSTTERAQTDAKDKAKTTRESVHKQDGGDRSLNPQPIPPGKTNALNPQPIPPGKSHTLNPQPIPPGKAVSLNPQPIPPGVNNPGDVKKKKKKKVRHDD